MLACPSMAKWQLISRQKQRSASRKPPSKAHISSQKRAKRSDDRLMAAKAVIMANQRMRINARKMKSDNELMRTEGGIVARSGGAYRALGTRESIMNKCHRNKLTHLSCNRHARASRVCNCARVNARRGAAVGWRGNFLVRICLASSLTAPSSGYKYQNSGNRKAW